MSKHYIESQCKIFDLNIWEEAVYKQGEINGIDELASAIISKFTEYEKKGYVEHTNDGIRAKVREIAEQIKEGKE